MLRTSCLVRSENSDALICKAVVDRRETRPGIDPRSKLIEHRAPPRSPPAHQTLTPCQRQDNKRIHACGGRGNKTQGEKLHVTSRPAVSLQHGGEDGRHDEDAGAARNVGAADSSVFRRGRRRRVDRGTGGRLGGCVGGNDAGSRFRRRLALALALALARRRLRRGEGDRGSRLRVGSCVGRRVGHHYRLLRHRSAGRGCDSASRGTSVARGLAGSVHATRLGPCERRGGCTSASPLPSERVEGLLTCKREPENRTHSW